MTPAAAAATPPSCTNAIEPPEPLASDIAAQWGLDPSITFLNHGSFGARPKAVIEAQQRHRNAFEAEPIRWLAPERDGRAKLNRAKLALANLVGTSPQNTGFVTNATGAVNAVARSLKLEAGDEVAATTHVYKAVRQTLRHAAERAGASYREIDVPLPLASPTQIVSAIQAGLGERTRFLLIDHISSPTAVVFPVQEIIEVCRKRGVAIMIDGAHAPGMVPLDVERLDPDFYAGNLHKWVSAPVGAAFLWVRPDHQADVHPPVISHHLGAGLAAEFEWQATRDISPWLCVEDSIGYFAAFGWDRVMRHNHELAVWAHAMLCERWRVAPASPLDGSMLGSMATVELPNQARLKGRFESAARLQAWLYETDRVEVPVVDWAGRWWIRVSCQVYNRPEQYMMLASAVSRLA